MVDGLQVKNDKLLKFQKIVLSLAALCAAAPILITGIGVYTEWGQAHWELIRTCATIGMNGYLIFLFTFLGPELYFERKRMRAKKLAKSGKPEPEEQDVEDHEL